MTKLSEKFGKLEVICLDPDTIKVGDIVTTYHAKTDTLTVYQRQDNGFATVHVVSGVNEVRCCSGVTLSELKAILPQRVVVKMPLIVSGHVMGQIPNVFLKKKYGDPTWLGWS